MFSGGSQFSDLLSDAIGAVGGVFTARETRKADALRLTTAQQASAGLAASDNARLQIMATALVGGLVMVFLIRRFA